MSTEYETPGASKSPRVSNAIAPAASRAAHVIRHCSYRLMRSRVGREPFPPPVLGKLMPTELVQKELTQETLTRIESDRNSFGPRRRKPGKRWHSRQPKHLLRSETTNPRIKIQNQASSNPPKLSSSGAPPPFRCIAPGTWAIRSSIVPA